MYCTVINELRNYAHTKQHGIFVSDTVIAFCQFYGTTFHILMSLDMSSSRFISLLMHKSHYIIITHKKSYLTIHSIINSLMHRISEYIINASIRHDHKIAKS